MWLPKQLAQDAVNLANVQDQIIYKYIDDPVWSNFNILFINHILGNKFDPILSRVHKTETLVENIKPLSDQDKINLAANY